MYPEPCFPFSSFQRQFPFPASSNIAIALLSFTRYEASVLVDGGGLRARVRVHLSLATGHSNIDESTGV